MRDPSSEENRSQTVSGAFDDAVLDRGARRDDMRVGDLFREQFVLGRCLGMGGMGSVWEARELPSGRRVALKALHDHLTGDKELVARFLREGRAALEAKHSAHVIEVIDVVQPRHGGPYLVMEYLDGEDLYQIVTREGALEPSRAVELIIQACLAVAEVHSHGIIHRDIKPENIFVTRLKDGTEWVKLLDFGVAKFRRPLGGVEGTLTCAGCTLGTPNYMAPEQAAASGDIDHRVDVYSMGAVLYELLTGERPFIADDPLVVLDLVAAGKLVPPREIRPEICELLEAVVLEAMAHDPDERFATMDELAEALEPLTGSCAPVRPAPSATDTIRTEPLFGDERPTGGTGSSSAPTGRFSRLAQSTPIPRTVVVRAPEPAIHDRETLIKRPRSAHRASGSSSPPTGHGPGRWRGPWWLAALVGVAVGLGWLVVRQGF